MGEWGSWQHGFRRVSRVGLAAQFSQGQRGGERSTVFAGLRRVTRVGLAAQFSQGRRGKVGSTVLARPAGWCWQQVGDLLATYVFSLSPTSFVRSSARAFEQALIWQERLRKASGVGFATQFSRSQRGGVGITVVAGPAGWVWQHIVHRPSGVWLEAHIKHGQWGGVGSTVFAGPAGRRQRLQGQLGGVGSAVLAGPAG